MFGCLRRRFAVRGFGCNIAGCLIGEVCAMDVKCVMTVKNNTLKINNCT